MEGGGAVRLQKRVKAATIETVAVILNVIGAQNFLPQTGGLIRLYRRATDLLHQKSGIAKAPVADHLRGQTEARAARQQAVFRIRCSNSGVTLDDCRYVALVTIRLLHRFHVPSGAHEFRRQPIEQSRMRRPFALRPEIVDRLH